MQINSINQSNTNFKSNIPCKIVQRTVNNTFQEVPEHFEKGIVMALVKRLNLKTSKEKTFLASLVPDFAKTPVATSSYLGAKNIFKDRNVILADDALWVNSLRDECYRKQNLTVDETNDIIHRTIIDPIKNKVRFFKNKYDKIGEPASLILYVDKQGRGFKLNGIDMTSLDGKRTFAKLEPTVMVKKTDIKSVQPHQEIKQKEIIKQDAQLVQGDLFGYVEPKFKSAVLEDPIPNKRWKRSKKV